MPDPNNNPPVEDNGHRRRAVRRFGLTLGSILLVAAVAGLFWAVPKMTSEPKITLTAQELQAQTDKKLPFHFTTKKKVFTPTVDVTVSKVVIEVRDNVIHLDIDASASRKEREIALHASTTGTPRYDEKTGAFYFQADELVLGDFRVDDAPAGSRTTRILDTLAKVPLVGAKTEQWRAHAKAVVHDHVQEALQTYLDTHPVYKLQQGTFKRAAMKNIEVTNNTVVLTTSLWQVTAWVFSWIGIGVLAVAVLLVIVLCPEVLMIFAPLALFS